MKDSTLNVCFDNRSHYLVLLSWYEEDFQVVLDTYKWLVPQVITIRKVYLCPVEYAV